MDQLKNEVKYRIPERWTRKFHKYDIVDINIYQKKPGILDERGKINKAEMIKERQAIEKQTQMSILKSANRTSTQNQGTVSG